MKRNLFHPRRQHQSAIKRIREGLQLHAVGFIIGEQQFSSLLIPLVSPPVPLADGIFSRETLERSPATDAHLAFNGFEAPAIPQLPADAAEIDVRLFQAAYHNGVPRAGISASHAQWRLAPLVP